jgi:hypothetical protein
MKDKRFDLPAALDLTFYQAFDADGKLLGTTQERWVARAIVLHTRGGKFVEVQSKPVVARRVLFDMLRRDQKLIRDTAIESISASKEDV